MTGTLSLSVLWNPLRLISYSVGKTVSDKFSIEFRTPSK